MAPVFGWCPLIDVDRFVADLAAGRDLDAFHRAWELGRGHGRVGAALLAAGVHPDDVFEDAVRVSCEIDSRLAARRPPPALELEATSVLAASVVSSAFTPPPAAHGLSVHPALVGRLPLLRLAESIAVEVFDGRLAVGLLVVIGDVVGLFTRLADGGMILLADRSDDGMAVTFAHELAHALDPDLAAVEPIGREVFAEVLAPLLLEHQPDTVEEAAPLIAGTLAEVGPVRRRLPVSVGDLLASAAQHVRAAATESAETIERV